jgi:hypothetical protein
MTIIVRTVLVLVLSLAFVRGATAAGANVINQVKNDVSAPLSSMAGTTSPAAVNAQGPFAQPTGPALGNGTPDPVAHQLAGALAGVSAGFNFEGQNADDQRSLLGFSYVPPDTNAAVGATQIVQMVNVTLSVYDKATGAILLGPLLLNDVWSGFGTLCETVQGGDPVVLYDQLARRWIVSQLAFNANFSQNFQCIAVSQTSDATGRYNRYAFAYGTTLNDYPKFGVWPDAYYYTTNLFAPSGGTLKFAGAQACAFDRNAMIHGKPASAICFQAGASVASLLPANLDGATLPPSGAPGIFAGIADASDLNFFRMHVDFKTPANSTFTGTMVPVAPFSEICARAITVACIPQPAPGERVDGLGDRLMYRLAYRNFGDHESLVVNHTVAGGPLAAVRWYEIRNPEAPSVFQQGTIFDNQNNYWMGSVAMDKAGNIALGFSASSSSLFPSIFVAGRHASDPAGNLSGPLVLKAGSGSQLANSFRRWGDYSSMAIDPSDDCTFWYTQEYYAASGVINWATHLSSVKFDNCQ